MKIKNQLSVALAFSIAMTATLAGKLNAKSELDQNAVNNNVYGTARTGPCVLADPNDLEYGCTVSMSGSICHVLIEVNGVTEIAQAFKSPIAGAMCGLTLRTPY